MPKTIQELAINALDAMTGSGHNNVAVGYSALTALTSGGDNIAVGVEALATITDGDEKCGYRALWL